MCTSSLDGLFLDLPHLHIPNLHNYCAIPDFHDFEAEMFPLI